MANKVELYNNGVLVGTDNSPVVSGSNWTYSISYTADSGNDVLTAKAFVDNVEVASSGVRNVVVNAGGPVAPIIDTYSGAKVGLSLQKIDSTYSGPCLKVRVGTGTTLHDIGFDANGKLDEAAILALSTTENIYVNTWYDQSPLRANYVQSTDTDARQPLIAEAGVICKVMGQPSILIYPNRSLYRPASQIVNVTNGRWSAFGLVRYNSQLTTGAILFGQDGTPRIAQYLRDNQTKNGVQSIGFTASAAAVVDNSPTNANYFDNLILQTGINTGAMVESFVNGLSDGGTAITNPQTSHQSGSAVGGRGDGLATNNTSHLNVCEIIVFNEDKTTDRPAIESNINVRHGR